MMEPKILYEDKYVLVIDKPSGLMVHDNGRSSEPLLTDWLLQNYPEIKDVGEPINMKSKVIKRPGIVHRLDKETSGAMLITKNQEAYLHFKKQFQNRQVQKIYNAFVYDSLKKETGSISKPLIRSSRNFRQHTTSKDGGGRMAITHYIVIKKNALASYLEVIPKTGRTHQIRVHLKSIGHPIVCDKLYAPNKPCILGFNRLALHSRSVTFSTGEKKNITVEAPLPPDFVSALEELKAS